MAAVDPGNPQSWNRYAYVVNNPLALTDPTGLQCVALANGTFTDDGRDPPCSWAPKTTITVTGNSGIPPELEFYWFQMESLLYYLGNGSGGGGSQPANNGKKQTKQQCIDDFLKSNYGNLVGGKVVPDFSLISISTNFLGYAKSSALTLAVKGGLITAPKVLSWVATTTGKNLASYPGMATASADALESGAFWGTTAATAEWAIAPATVGAAAFSTTADAYARWSCRNVQ